MSRGRDPDRRPPRTSVLTAPSTRLGIAFVLLVAGSCGLIAFQGGAALPQVGLAMGVGLAAGGGLFWYLRWILE